MVLQVQLNVDGQPLYFSCYENKLRKNERFKETAKLLDYAFTNFQQRKLLPGKSTSKR